MGKVLSQKQLFVSFSFNIATVLQTKKSLPSRRYACSTRDECASGRIPGRWNICTQGGSPALVDAAVPAVGGGGGGGGYGGRTFRLCGINWNVGVSTGVHAML